MGRGRPPECLWFQPVTAFLNEIKPVGFHVAESLLLTSGPLDLHGFSTSGLAQAEISTQIALREIAPSTLDFPDLRNAAGDDSYSRTHRVTIGLCARKPEIQKMISVAAAVAQQQRNVAVVGDHNVHESVVIEVRERDAPSDIWSLKSWTR